MWPTEPAAPINTRPGQPIYRPVLGSSILCLVSPPFRLGALTGRGPPRLGSRPGKAIKRIFGSTLFKSHPQMEPIFSTANTCFPSHYKSLKTGFPQGTRTRQILHMSVVPTPLIFGRFQREMGRKWLGHRMARGSRVRRSHRLPKESEKTGSAALITR